MLNFYNYPSWCSLTASILSVTCILFWTTALIYEVYSRHNKTLSAYINEAYQILILCVWFVSLGMIAYIRMGFERNQLLGARYTEVRWILCILAVICYLIKGIYQWKSQTTGRKTFICWKCVLFSVLNLLPAVMIIPTVERTAGKYYPYIFMSGLVIEILFSLFRILNDIKNLREQLSWYSIKEAVDRLPTGVLFAKKDGRILLINLQMQKLSDIIFGTQLWDARILFEDCMENKMVQNNCKRTKLDNSFVYKLPDESIWLFSKTELVLKRQKDIQVTATNITKQWQMTQELRKQKKELEEQRQKFKQSLKELQTVIREEEILNIRSRFHDILGQRIAILLRSLREGKIPDEQLLTSFMNDFYDEFEDPARREQHIERLDALCKVMEKIGVELRFELVWGSEERHCKRIDLCTVIDITEREKKDLGLCLDVLREACTNAVRHGFASLIVVRFRYVYDELHIFIRNDGIKPEGAIHEGSGLRSIKRKLEAVGGSLSIIADPQFTLCIKFTGREVNDKSIDC